VLIADDHPLLRDGLARAVGARFELVAADRDTSATVARGERVLDPSLQAGRTAPAIARELYLSTATVRSVRDRSGSASSSATGRCAWRCPRRRSRRCCCNLRGCLISA
jgi:DNA-binding NarL/FixJ family response regulator